MSFRPLYDYILVEPAQAATSASSVLLPETVQKKPQQGCVLAIGRGRRDKDGKRAMPQVAVGDKVIYGAWTGIEVKIEGVDCLIMKQGEVLGVVSGAGEVVVRDRLGAGANTATSCVVDHVHGLDCCDD
jgi:chaperonin GroES